MLKNKKLFVFNLGVLLAIVFSLASVISGSGHYTLHTNTFSADSVTPSVEVSYDREGVVELTDYYMQNNELILEFDAVGKGDTKAARTQRRSVQHHYGRDKRRSEFQRLFYRLLYHRRLADLYMGHAAVDVYGLPKEG